MTAYQNQANLMKALAHPARLQILDILSHGEACVCHLTAVLDQRQPYVSQHLSVLRDAGLVLDERDGTIVYYRLASQQVAALLQTARAAMADLGLDVSFPPVPVGPVAGCPCPHCCPNS